MSISVFGLLASLASLCARRFPRWKVTPADDSFRVSCTIKTALVMLKAYIVFELGKEPASVWKTVVTVLFFSSFLVMAMMTLPEKLPK